jgi:hypothetical protein
MTYARTARDNAYIVARLAIYQFRCPKEGVEAGR